MTRVGFIMRAHPRDEAACLVGGATKNPYRLLRSLRTHVDVAGVLVVDQSGRFTSRGYPVRGVRVPVLRLYARTLAWNVLTFAWVLRLFARADIVQCHHPHYGLGAAIARRAIFRNVRFIVKAHGTALPEMRANRYAGLRGRVLAWNAAAHRLHDRWVLRAADVCVVSSDHQFAEMRDLYDVAPRRLRRIYNGVDPEFVRVRDRPGDEAAGAPRFVFVGRLVPKKGYRQLRTIYGGLREQFPDATLTLVLGHRVATEDPATHRYVAQELGSLPGCRVEFDVSEAALYDLFSTSDVGLVPSDGYESIPTVVLEMCAAGLPVFATYAWGIPEVLPPELGLSGDAGSDVARVAAFVRTKLAMWDSDGWARQYARFGYDRLAAEYRDLYEEVADRGRA